MEAIPKSHDEKYPAQITGERYLDLAELDSKTEIILDGSFGFDGSKVFRVIIN